MLSIQKNSGLSPSRPQHTIEELLGLSTEIKVQAEELAQALLALEQVIAREQKAIAQYDLAKLEEVVELKTQVGLNIQSRFEKLQLAGLKLSDWYQRHFSGPEPEVGYVSQHRQMIQSLRQLFEPDLLAQKVLDHLLGGLDRALETFQTRSMALKPLIEANRSMTERLLMNHYQNVQFWQELMQESTQLYNARGVTKSRSDAPNVFRVKA